MRTYLIIAMLMLGAGTVAPLTAQGWIDPIPGGGGHGVDKVRTDVRTEVVGRVAIVQVEEWFRNRGARLGEGVYLYPLPGEAVFSSFSLYQDDRELRGEMMDADKARSIYEEIVRRKRDPALIELVGQGLVRARVFPINPGETRKITLRYTQLLGRSGDALQFRYLAGRRGTNLPNSRPPQERPVAPDPAPITFTLVADSGAMFDDPFSPTHRVRVDREDGRLRVRPQEELSGTFSLFLPFAREVVGIALATHRPSSTEPGYFMLTLSPGRATGATLPRDITVVLDVSGSMSGSKLEQARDALRQMLESLDGDDRFRLIAFSNRVTAYRAGWTGSSNTELAPARRWLNGLVADGGTNIAGALEEAFDAQTPTGRLPIVLFLTDGLPSVGEQDPERIAERARADRGRNRVFAFGVGYDVNTYLLDRLTEAGRGATQFVEPGEDVGDALGTLLTKIRHPVLTDLAIDRAPARLTEIFPNELPDLFVGDELTVFGRYELRGAPEGTLSIRGRRNDAAERFESRVGFPEHDRANDFIPRLWAARKLGHLTRTIRLEGHSARLEEEIRQLALRYGLLSEYSSYLVQEPDPVLAADRTRGGGGSGSIAMPSVAPAQAAGQMAVMAAKRSQEQREAQSQVELEELNDRLAARAGGPAQAHVAGRFFALTHGVWTDLAHDASVPVVDIEPYSDAYFALVALAPELEQWLKAFDAVLVAGAETSIRIADGGASQMTDTQLARLVRLFRGH